MDNQPLLDYITNHIVLSSEEESLLHSKIKYRKYLKGQYLVQQGDVCNYLSFVCSGCLKTFHVDDEGQEHIIRFAIENWWTADLGSFIEQRPADCSVQCLEHTDLIQFSFESLTMLYIEIPKLERLFRIIFQNAFVSSEKRLMNNFSLTAKERYLIFLKEYPQIEQRIPQYMIASYLGFTKEFLSKIRSQLIHEQ